MPEDATRAILPWHNIWQKRRSIRPRIVPTNGTTVPHVEPRLGATFAADTHRPDVGAAPTNGATAPDPQTQALAPSYQPQR